MNPKSSKLMNLPWAAIGAALFLSAVTCPRAQPAFNDAGEADTLFVPTGAEDPSSGIMPTTDVPHANEFFQNIATNGNGRTCETCHLENQGWSILTDRLQALFDATSGDTSGTVGEQAIFRPIDAATNPAAKVNTREQQRKAYGLLLERGVIRIRLAVPRTEFEVIQVDDPPGFNTFEPSSLISKSGCSPLKRCIGRRALWMRLAPWAVPPSSRQASWRIAMASISSMPGSACPARREKSPTGNGSSMASVSPSICPMGAGGCAAVAPPVTTTPTWATRAARIPASFTMWASAPRNVAALTYL